MTLEEIQKRKASAEDEITKILRTLELNFRPARLERVSVEIVDCSTIMGPKETHVGRVTIEVAL